MFFTLKSNPVRMNGNKVFRGDPASFLKAVRSEIHDKLEITIKHFGLEGIQVKGYFWEFEDKDFVKSEELYLSDFFTVHFLVSANAETLDHLRHFQQKNHEEDPTPIHFFNTFPPPAHFWSSKKTFGPSTLDNFLAVADFFKQFHRASGFFFGEPRKGKVGYSSNINLNSDEWDDFCNLHYALNGFRRKKNWEEKKIDNKPAPVNILDQTELDLIPGFFGEFVREENNEPLSESEKSQVLSLIIDSYECKEVLIGKEWVPAEKLETERLFENIKEIEISALTHFIRFQGTELSASFAKPFTLAEEKSFIQPAASRGFLTRLNLFARKT